MDSFNDFKVSIEDFAAFIDGNLSSQDAENLSAVIKSDNDLSSILKVSQMTEETFDEFEENGFDAPEFLSMSDFNIPQIPDNDINDDESDQIEEDGDNINQSTGIMALEEIDTENMKTTGFIEEAHKQYGLEPLNIEFDPNTYQWESDTCAIRSQELVLRSFGIETTQEELIKEAEDHGWYKEGDGTSIENVGNLLDLHDVPNHRMVNANVFNLVDELGQGHKVIVGVDLDELEGNSFWQSIKECLVGKTPNHAMIVSGINTTDPNNIKVVLTDPGTGKTLFECPYNKFLSAWNDSSCFMVATDEPAPLEYNHNEMIHFDYDKSHVSFLGKLPFEKYHEEVMPTIDSVLDPAVDIDDYIDSVDRCIADLELAMLTDFSDPKQFDQMMEDFAKSSKMATQVQINNINNMFDPDKRHPDLKVPSFTGNNHDDTIHPSNEEEDELDEENDDLMDENGNL